MRIYKVYNVTETELDPFLEDVSDLQCKIVSVVGCSPIGTKHAYKVIVRLDQLDHEILSRSHQKLTRPFLS